MSESGTETVFVYLMFLFGHVDFVVMFLKEPRFPFYKTGHKSVEVFERGAKNLLLKLWQNISREKEKKRKKRNQWKYLSKESSSQVLAKHFKRKKRKKEKSVEVFEQRIFFPSSGKTFQDSSSALLLSFALQKPIEQVDYIVRSIFFFSPRFLYEQSQKKLFW